MRIGIFTDSYYPHVSGVATSIDMLKEALIKMKHEVYLVIPDLDTGKFSYDKKNKILYMPGVKTGIYKTRLTRAHHRRAFNIVKSWNLDVIHSQTEFGVGKFSRICSKKLNIPVVHTYHTLYEDYVYYVTHGLFDKFAKKIVVKITQNYCDKKCDECIVPTNKIKDLFENKYDITRTIHVIPTGIDIKKFAPSKDLRTKAQNIRKKYNIKPDDFLIGSIGRIAIEKSFDRLINCVDKMSKINQKVKLMLVGDGPAIDDLKKQVQELKLEKNVIFTGLVDYNVIPAYYQALDIMASFSVTETQGLTIIEGLAAAKPTLCIEDDSFKAMVQDSYNGYLFKDEDEFIEKTFNLMNNKELYKEMSNNAKNSTYQYSKEVFGSEVLKVYNMAIKKHRK